MAALRDVVVYERVTDTGKPELGFRLIHMVLPAGSAPVAFQWDGKATILGGQWFTEDEILQYLNFVNGEEVA